MAKDLTVALVGNPNSGKTTVFNNLTGARQYVGNWPGVTVEKKTGSLDYDAYHIEVVDLPGVYSLTAYSMDEIITRNFVVDERPDVVVDIVDASSLERNLYLTVQLLEMGARLVVALNMMDQAESRGYTIDVAGVSRLLGVSVVPMSANRNRGTTELLKEIVRVADENAPVKPLTVRYGREIEEEISKLESLISETELSEKYPPRWLALKLLEGDEEIADKFRD
jgi:small GTP-binding protein